MRWVTAAGMTKTRMGEHTTIKRMSPTMNLRWRVSQASTRKAGTTPRYDARESVKAKGSAMRPMTPMHSVRSRRL